MSSRSWPWHYSAVRCANIVGCAAKYLAYLEVALVPVIMQFNLPC